MNVSSAEIRQRVAKAIRGADGFVRSTFAPDRFGLEPRSLAHLAFSVGLPGPSSSDPGRQLARGGRSLETWSMQPVVVRWSHRIRPDAEDADYDEALAAELVMVAAALELDRTDLVLRFDQVVSRQVLSPAPGGVPWFLGVVRFIARHQYALAAT